MNEMAFRVTSNDGTTIAYDVEGSGPPIVFVHGMRVEQESERPSSDAIVPGEGLDLALGARDMHALTRPEPSTPTDLGHDISVSDFRHLQDDLAVGLRHALEPRERQQSLRRQRDDAQLAEQRGEIRKALAELMGIIVNGGVRLPTSRIEELHFAQATPYETVMRRAVQRPERVMKAEVAATLKAALTDVVEEGDPGTPVDFQRAR